MSTPVPAVIFFDLRDTLVDSQGKRYSDALDALQVLHERGYRLGLLSNQPSGTTVHLQEQPLQLLILLAQRPGELFEREEIRQKLWAQDTFVEFDDSVNHAIRKVREALGDSATSPRFIETVPRQGYRFIATS